MFYMLTATEVVFIKDLIIDLSDGIEEQVSEPVASIWKKEVDTALELLNKIEPIDTESVLDLLDSIEDKEHDE